MIRIDDRAWLLWAVWVLVLPLKWLLAAAAAACIHELFHIGAVLLLGGQVRQVRLGTFAAVIEAVDIEGFREAACALAGPVGSFLTLLLIHRAPLLGLCGLIHGTFNLLPVYPMDGGRALRCLLEALVPDCVEKILDVVESTFFFVIFGSIIWGAIRYSLGYLPVLFCGFGILCVLLRKKP